MSATSIASNHGSKPPATKTLRLVGPADVVDVASLARVLPDPDTLPSGVLVVVLPHVVDPPSLANRFLAALGRGRTVSRALRASAMVARGYVRVAAGIDRETRSDLVWGYSSSNEQTVDS